MNFQLLSRLGLFVIFLVGCSVQTKFMDEKKPGSPIMIPTAVPAIPTLTVQGPRPNAPKKKTLVRHRQVVKQIKPGLWIGGEK
ncbi:MAG TPA: hypothetical protein VMT55_00160 [Candidatus Sulfotelmatobacter sp.]|nr:hypothetical protein [Candidatus Sulfotelmatobacter sp.]